MPVVAIKTFYFKPPDQFLAFKRLGNTDFMKGPWNAALNYALYPPRHDLGKDCFLLNPGKQKGCSIFCSSLNQEADSLLRFCKSAYGIAD